jgi:hypothetical protein
MLRMLAKKLRCRPRNSGIKLISERLAAYMLAFARPGNLRLRQTELLLMYIFWIKTFARVYRP